MYSAEVIPNHKQSHSRFQIEEFLADSVCLSSKAPEGRFRRKGRPEPRPCLRMGAARLFAGYSRGRRIRPVPKWVSALGLCQGMTLQLAEKRSSGVGLYQGMTLALIHLSFP